MTTMVTELYDALREAGASEGKARSAAEALANYDDRFNRLDRNLDLVDRKIDSAVSDLERKLDLIDRKIDSAVSDLERKFELTDRKIDSAVADLERKLDRKIDGAVADLQRKIDFVERKVDAVQAEQILLRWMVGATLAMSVAILVKLFVH